MSEGPIDMGAAGRAIADGLRLCLAGEAAAGLACYRSAARPRAFGRLPLGLHVHLIEEAGRTDAADELRRMTLNQGGDLAWRAKRAGATQAEAATEYEALFARGHGNARMVSNYALVLESLGRSPDIAALFDQPRRLRFARLDCAGEVAESLLTLEAGMGPSVREVVHHTRERLDIDRLGDPAIDRLMAACRVEMAAYFTDWATSGHPLANLVPDQFGFSAWGHVSRGDGHATRHNHPVGWASAVFYPVGLDADEAGGNLRLGGWDAVPPPGWPDAKIRPEAGLLVMMPSWYVHWTEPLEQPGLRIAIAIDAIPARS